MNEMLHVLRELGFSEYETRSYLSLLRMPRCSAPALAKEANIPTGKVYDVLGRLVCRGIVLEEAGKPKRFRGMDPEIAITSIIRKRREELEKMEEGVGAKLKSLMGEDNDKGIWMVRGRENVERLLDSIISNTKEKLTIRYSPGTMCLEKVVDLLKGNENGIEIDSQLNSVNTNMVNSDGREMVVYLNKKEALWIRDQKYCKTPEQWESKYVEVN